MIKIQKNQTIPDKSPNILYLASKSASRKMLLEQARIPYLLIEQNADETKCDWNLPLDKVVQSIAKYKIDQAIMPQGHEGQIVYVLTADTLSQDPQGALQGKPTDLADATAKIISARGLNICGTAFCLEQRKYIQGTWHTQKRIAEYVQSSYELYIPDDIMHEYITTTGAMDAAGAIKVEGFGAQFLKVVEGSYTSIVGLPMFELREALAQIGFFN